jgi:hypothetical protein
MNYSVEAIMALLRGSARDYDAIDGTPSKRRPSVRIAANHRMTLILGLLLLLMGTIWALQGLGLVRGSVMTGQSLWLVIGAIAALIGLGLVYWSLRIRPNNL